MESLVRKMGDIEANPGKTLRHLVLQAVRLLFFLLRSFGRAGGSTVPVKRCPDSCLRMGDDPSVDVDDESGENWARDDGDADGVGQLYSFRSLAT